MTLAFSSFHMVFTEPLKQYLIGETVKDQTHC